MSGNHVCPWWMAYTFDNPLRQLIHNPEKMFVGYVTEGMTVLDVGCGMGYFSLGLARIVGNSGRVISVDLQRKMLDVLRQRAAKAGLASRIELHCCSADALHLTTPVDFILAFWMVHETPDPGSFFTQLASLLKPAGKLLYAEPSFHVTDSRYRRILAAAQKSGFNKLQDLKITFSRAALLSV